jgi:hypothetical protein
LHFRAYDLAAVTTQGLLADVNFPDESYALEPLLLVRHTTRMHDHAAVLVLDDAARLWLMHGPPAARIAQELSVIRDRRERLDALIDRFAKVGGLYSASQAARQSVRTR